MKHTSTSALAEKSGRRESSVKIERIVASSLLASMLVAAGLNVYWTFIDIGTPVTLTGPSRLNPQFHPDGQSVEQGGVLHYTRSYCVTEGIPGQLRRTITDGVVWALPPMEIVGEPGCHTERTFMLELPQAIPPGAYSLNVHITYERNPLTTARFEFDDVHFVIIPKKDDVGAP